MRKRFTIFFLLVAQAIVLSHGLFPHVHIEDFPHTHDQHHGDSHDDSDWGQLFSAIQHAGEQITFTPSDKPTFSVEKKAVQPLADVAICDSRLAEYHVIHQRHTFPPDRGDPSPSVHLLSYSLRGPPSFIVA